MAVHLSSHSLLLAFCWGLRGIQLLKNATLPAKVVKIAHALTILNFCLSYNYIMDTSSCIEIPLSILYTTGIVLVDKETLSESSYD